MDEGALVHFVTQSEMERQIGAGRPVILEVNAGPGHHGCDRWGSKALDVRSGQSQAERLQRIDGGRSRGKSACSRNLQTRAEDSAWQIAEVEFPAHETEVCCAVAAQNFIPTNLQRVSSMDFR